MSALWLPTQTVTPSMSEVRLTDADARTLRAYKKILAKYGYREKLWCQTCEENEDSPGCRGSVFDSRIVIECHHRRLWFRGST